jgi:hypothetical protein
MIGVVAWIMIAFFRVDGVRMLSSLAGFPSLFLCFAAVICAARVLMDPARFDLFKDGYDAEGYPLRPRRRPAAGAETKR